MKKLFAFPFVLSFAYASIAHFKLSSVKEAHKNFRESASFFEGKYKKAMEELQKTASELEELRGKLVAKGDKATKEEREEFQRRLSLFEQDQMLKQEELQNTSKLLEEQIRVEIAESVKNKLGKTCLIEGSILLFGGEDATKFVIDSLSGKNTSLKNSGKDLKVGYLDLERFVNESADYKSGRKFVEDKIAKFQKRLKEILAAKDKKDFDEEAAQKELVALRNEAEEANKLTMERLLSSIKKTASFVAEKKGYDLVVSKEIVFSGGDDVTEHFIKNYGSEGNPKSDKVAFVDIERSLENYKKYSNMKTRHEKLRENLEEELHKRYTNIQKMRDEKKSPAEIKKAEEEFGRERSVRGQALVQSMKSENEEILQSVKAAARRIAEKKGYPVVVVDSEMNAGVYFPGADITEEVAKSLND